MRVLISVNCLDQNTLIFVYLFIRNIFAMLYTYLTFSLYQTINKITSFFFPKTTHMIKTIIKKFKRKFIHDNLRMNNAETI